MSSPRNVDVDRQRREDALRFLQGRIDYERAQTIPYPARHFKLDRMQELLQRLGDPHLGLPAVHIAGTKGKGSTAAMVAAVLHSAGYRTGLFTSPHLDRVEERLVVDGQPCSPAALVELIERVRPAIEVMDRTAAASGPPEEGPTFFEVVTAMAMLHYAQREVDVAVLEVGLGGRLDATNVCSPLVSVITSISFDHTRQLGNTLESIAHEKAGIIKPGIPVVSGVVEPSPREVVRQTCRRQGCRLSELGIDFDFDYHPPRRLDLAESSGRVDYRHLRGSASRCSGISLALPGRHQAANAALALAVVDELRRVGWTIPDEAARLALASLRWPARVEVLSRRPTVVVDAAHNVASVEALVGVLDESFWARRRLLVFAASDDKDIRGMFARLLEKFDHVILTRYSNNPRAIPPEELGAIAAELTGRRYPLCRDPAEALDEARAVAGPDDLICVAGSFFLAAEIRQRVLAGTDR